MPPDPPKAHRRLVPRVPRPVEKPEAATPPPPEDLDVTVKRVMVSLDDDDAAMEMTRVRESPLAVGTVDPDDHDHDLDVTAQRRPAPPLSGAESVLDEDEVITADPDDAGETMAIPTRAQTEPPEPPDLRDPGQSDLEIEIQRPRELPIPSYAMHAAKEASMPKFGPTWSTLAGGSHEAPPPPMGSLLRPPPPPELDPDPNAFSELEPTSLKAPVQNFDAVEDRPTTHISPAERGLLAAMSEGHEASRKIYMQWLERRGEKTRAEYLRLEMQLAAMNPLDIRFQATQDQLRDVAQKISVDWRSRVSRSLIENCRAPGVQCPTYWRALPADGDDVRRCPACRDQVFYCVTLQLARGRVQAGQRVALDVTVERSPDDLLEARCAGCGSSLPGETRFCPHCGRSTMY